MRSRRCAHAGAAYTVTGPEASSPREQVAILSELLDPPITAQEVSIEEALESMLDAAWPAWPVARMGELFHLYAVGLAEGVSTDVERVLGRSARSYRDFATNHREAFTS